MEEGLLTRQQLDELLKLEAMTAPSRARGARSG
jgi:aspartate ammonia-lyase